MMSKHQSHSSSQASSDSAVASGGATARLNEFMSMVDIEPAKDKASQPMNVFAGEETKSQTSSQGLSSGVSKNQRQGGVKAVEEGKKMATAVVDTVTSLFKRGSGIDGKRAALNPAKELSG